MSIRAVIFDPSLTVPKDPPQMTEPRPVFPLDDNTFILNGRARPSLRLASPPEEQNPAEEVGPNNLPEDQRGQYKRRMWAGVGLWAFIILAAVVAIPIGIGAVVIAFKAKPAPAIATLPETFIFPPVARAPAPAAPTTPSPNVIEDMRRFAATITLPSAYPPHHEISRPRTERIISHRHHLIASKLEEPPPPTESPIGCPPSVCFPPQPRKTNPSGQHPSAIDLDEAGQRITTWSRR